MKPIPPPKCPNCDEPLDSVWSTTDETFIWKGEGDIGHYERGDNGSAEERCPYCHMKYPCANDKTGDVSCVDVQKNRRIRRLK